MDENKHTICELCNISVTHDSGMTNLQSNLHLNGWIFVTLSTNKSDRDTFKTNITQSEVEDFVCLLNLPATSQ